MSLSQAGTDVLFSEDSASETPETAGRGGQEAGPATRAEQPSCAPSSGSRQPDPRRILGLSVSVTVVLAERMMPIESLLNISVGTIIEFDVAFDTELTFTVADRPIASGYAVKVGENFGIRIAEIGTVNERIHALGGH